MTIEEKVDRVKAFLDEQELPYRVNYTSKRAGCVIPLAVMKPWIAVYFGESDEFFQRVKKYYSPLFVRDDESMEFVIEKLSNVIQKALVAYNRATGKKKGTKKERLQYAKECWLRHQARLARRTEHEHKKVERAAATAGAARPKRKRIVRYEKVGGTPFRAQNPSQGNLM